MCTYVQVQPEFRFCLAEEDGRGGEFTGPSANGSVGDFVAGPGAVGGSLECGAVI